MRGSIIKRSENSYRISVSLGKDPTTGKYRQYFETVPGGRRIAEKRLGQLLHQLDTGSFVKPAVTTIKDFLEQWLRDYAKVNLSPKGYERYESIVRVHLMPSLGNIPLTRLRPEHIQKHYSAKLS